MVTTLEWLDEHNGRVMADQRARVETAKLGSTVALAIDVGVLVAALQIESADQLATASTITAVAAGAAAVVFLLDLLKLPDPRTAIPRGSEIADHVKLRALRRATLTSIRFNRQVVLATRGFMMLCVGASVVATSMAINWMLLADRGGVT